MSEHTELARAEEDFARRQRAVRRRGRRRWLVVSAVVALVLIVAWTVLYSSWFEVAGVRVVGVDAVPEDRVTTVAAVPLGASLVRLDTGAISRRVEAIPAIADAKVSRAWPDRIVIRVTERVPFVALAVGDGFELIDAAGVAFRTVASRPEGLPSASVTGLRRETTLRSVVTVIQALPDDLKRRLPTVTAQSPDSIRLHLDPDIQVVWGSAEDSARKAQVLTVLMKRPAKIYDVSAPDMPTTQGKPR